MKICQWILLIALSNAFGAMANTAFSSPDPDTEQQTLAFIDCRGPAPADAKCGTLLVPEAPGGREIELYFVVLPATDDGEPGSPVFLFAGGPGQSATSLAAFSRDMYGEIQGKRDLVLLDIRGTGHSSPLACGLYDDATRAQDLLGDMFPIDKIRQCREELEQRADLTRYTSSEIVDDVERLRSHLGYDRLTLFGISYGTRVAQLYAQRYPDHAESLILQGLVPPDTHSPKTYAQDTQRALDGLLNECAAQPECHEVFPDIAEQLEELFASVRREPARVAVLDPFSGKRTEVSLDHGALSESVRYYLYGPGSSVFLPSAISQAADGDYTPFAESLMLRRQMSRIAQGLYLSVICSEDVAHMDLSEANRLADNTFMGDYRIRQYRDACRLWPIGQTASELIDPPIVQTPTLLISGQWDPVTPPGSGEQVAALLPNNHHLVVPNAGHSYTGLSGSNCVTQSIIDFVQTPDPESLETDACVQSIGDLDFYLESAVQPPAALTQGQLQRLAGLYETAQLNDPVSLRVHGDGLRVLGLESVPLMLAPISEDHFRVVGANGAAVSFTLQDERVIEANFTLGPKRLVLTPVANDA